MHVGFFSFPISPEAFQLTNLCVCVAAALSSSVMSIAHVRQHPGELADSESTAAHPGPAPLGIRFWGCLLNRS